MTAIAKPARGAAFTDPQFGTRIVRVTDVAAQFGAGVAKPAYSTIPVWNADESLMLLYVTLGGQTGFALFDGHTYAFLRFLDIAPTDIEHWYWSSTDPDVLMYPHASGNTVRELVRLHVSTGAKDILRTFTGAAGPAVDAIDFGTDPMYGSWDNTIVGLRSRGATLKGFTLDLRSSTESSRIAGDAPQIAPSGSRYVMNGGVYATSTGALIRPLATNPDEHADQTRLPGGDDVRASAQFDGAITGTLVTENLTTGAVRTVIGEATGYPYPPSGTHLSGHAFKAPGWVAVSITGTGSGATLLDNELLLVDLSTDRVYRVAHTRTAGGDGPNGYWAEADANISPSGTRIAFASDWGGGATVDTYVVELPSYGR